MKLSADEADLFFRLQNALVLYANERLRVLPGVRDLRALQRCKLEDRLRLRDALYDHPELIDEFVAANPAGLSADELALVASWKQFVRGRFFIVRFLKRYAVFMTSEEPHRAYGVLGLTQEIEEVFYPLRPPIYTSAVLLPFKGRIIYDGLGGTYQIIFGPGVRASLKEDYQAIRERGEIIESLEPEAAGASAPRDRKAAGPAQSRAGTLSADTLALLERMAVDAERLRGADTPAAQRAFALLRAAIAMAQTAVATPTDATAWTRAYRRARTALHQLHTSLSRTGWRDS